MQIFRTVAFGYRPTWKIIAAAVMLSFYCTQTHMKLESEFSREFLKTIFARLPPLASAARCGPHPPHPRRYASVNKIDECYHFHEREACVCVDDRVGRSWHGQNVGKRRGKRHTDHQSERVNTDTRTLHRHIEPNWDTSLYTESRRSTRSMNLNKCVILNF